MKNVLGKAAVLGMVLAVATSMFAASSGTLTVSEPVQINGKTIAAGEYKVKWEGTSNTEVSILKGKQVVATATARVVEMSSAPHSDAAVLSKNADGTRTLKEIRFGGKKQSLALGEESAKSEMTGSSSK
jgi:hypothetical protein